MTSIWPSSLDTRLCLRPCQVLFSGLILWTCHIHFTSLPIHPQFQQVCIKCYYELRHVWRVEDTKLYDTESLCSRRSCHGIQQTKDYNPEWHMLCYAAGGTNSNRIFLVLSITWHYSKYLVGMNSVLLTSKGNLADRCWSQDSQPDVLAPETLLITTPYHQGQRETHVAMKVH